MQILTLAQYDDLNITLLRQIFPILPNNHENAEGQKTCAKRPYGPKHFPISVVTRSRMFASDRVIVHWTDPQGLLTAKIVVPLTGLRSAPGVDCPKSWAVAKTRGT